VSRRQACHQPQSQRVLGHVHALLSSSITIISPHISYSLSLLGTAYFFPSPYSTVMLLSPPPSIISISISFMVQSSTPLGGKIQGIMLHFLRAAAAAAAAAAAGDGRKVKAFGSFGIIASLKPWSMYLNIPRNIRDSEQGQANRQRKELKEPNLRSNVKGI
jgi:hypothetical protein